MQRLIGLGYRCALVQEGNKYLDYCFLENCMLCLYPIREPNEFTISLKRLAMAVVGKYLEYSWNSLWYFCDSSSAEVIGPPEVQVHQQPVIGCVH